MTLDFFFLQVLKHLYCDYIILFMELKRLVNDFSESREKGEEMGKKP